MEINFHINHRLVTDIINPKYELRMSCITLKRPFGILR